MSLRLCAGAGEANPPQTHPKCPCSITNSPTAPSAAPVGGVQRSPRGSAPKSIQTRLSAPSIPRRLHIPKAPTHLPRPQGPARSVAPSGSLSILFAPGASPGPSPDPAPSQQGSPVRMDAAGSQAQESPARAGTEGRGQPQHRHPRGVVGHPPPAPRAGRGREGARKSGCGFQSPRGKDVTARAGPARAGGCGHPRGGWQGVGCAPQRGFLAGLGPTGAAARRGSRRSESRSDGKPGARAATPAGTVWAWPGRGPGCPEVPQHRETL